MAEAQEMMGAPLMQQEYAAAPAVGAMDVKDAEMVSFPCLAIIGSIPHILCPCSCFYQLDANESAVLMHCGQLTGIEDDAGCHCALPAGREIRKISMKQRCLDLPDTKVVDRVGNPVVVSAVINYRVENASRALLNVESDLESMVRTNATGALKTTVQLFDYEQLRTDTTSFNGRLMQSLQPQLDRVGLRITSVSLNELSYAPEIASAMLKKQQAQALLDARQVVVDGALRLSQEAIQKLQEGGIMMDDKDKISLVRNLLTVTCSETATVPTVGLA